MFQFVLSIAGDKKLLSGKTVGVDSTTLEANAAMKSIVRRDTGEDWKQYVTRLMREDGTIEADDEPTDEEVRRYDKKRKNKRVSNEDWVSNSDPESRITQMKDGRTHLAYKAEHVVDLKSDIVLAAEIRHGRPGRHRDAGRQRDGGAEQPEPGRQRGRDRGGGGRQGLSRGAHVGTVPRPWDCGPTFPSRDASTIARWTDKPAEFQHAVYANRRRIKRAKSKRCQRLRSERVRTDLRPRVRHAAACGAVG